MNTFSIRPISDEDAKWVFAALQTGGKPTGNFHSILPSGFIAEKNARKVGLITYDIADTVCSIISLNALLPGKGIGTKLLEKVKETAQNAHCEKIVAITSTDNIPARKFYQKKGFILAGDAQTISSGKEDIPLPVQDEIVFVYYL